MKYPILRFNKDCIVKIEGRGRHHRMAPNDVRYWERPPDTIILDREGEAFTVKASKPSTVVWWNFLFLSTNKVYWMNWNIDSMGEMPIDELKDRVGKLVVQNRWYRQSRESEESFLKRLNRAHTYTEIFDVVNFYGRWVG